jgi:hypothetical protein
MTSEHRRRQQKRQAHLFNGDVGPEILATVNRVLDADFPARGTGNAVSRKLLLPLSLPSASPVVLGLNSGASLVAPNVLHNVAPPFVVVDANGNDDLLANVGLEADGAASSVAPHRQDQLAVRRLSPDPTISEAPGSFFDDMEVGVGVGLVNAQSDTELRGHSTRAVSMRKGVHNVRQT